MKTCSIVAASREKVIAFKCYGCPKICAKTQNVGTEVGNKFDKKKGFQSFFATHKNHSIEKLMSPNFIFHCQFH